MSIILTRFYKYFSSIYKSIIIYILFLNKNSKLHKLNLNVNNPFMENDKKINDVFILFAFTKFNIYWDKIIVASLIAWCISASFILFVPFGFVLAFASLSILCVGLEKYKICLLLEKEKPFETIFSFIKISPTAILLKFLKCLYTLFWSLFLIVPGIICALNYSFGTFLLADDPTLTSQQALAKSKIYTNGFRKQIFLIFLFCLFMFFVGICVCGAICVFLHLILKVYYIATIIILICLSMLIFLTVIVPYWQISITQLYLQSKQMHKSTKPKKRTINNSDSADKS